MTEGQVITLIGSLLGLALAALTIWRYVESRITKETENAVKAANANTTAEVAKEKAATAAEVAKVKEQAAAASSTASAHAALVSSELAAYKTHVAETYITKAGFREMRDEIMSGMRDLKGSVSNIHARIDQILTDRASNRDRT